MRMSLRHLYSVDLVTIRSFFWSVVDSAADANNGAMFVDCHCTSHLFDLSRVGAKASCECHYCKASCECSKRSDV
jgi:hypothetical protein